MPKNAAITDNKLRILVGNQIAGDPYPGILKDVFVRLQVQGSEPYDHSQRGCGACFAVDSSCNYWDRPPPSGTRQLAARVSEKNVGAAPSLLQLKWYNNRVQSLDAPEDRILARMLLRFPTGFCTLKWKT